MKKTAQGYAPEPGYLAHSMNQFPVFAAPEMPAYTIAEANPLLDSANMTPDDWLRIAHDIAAHYDDYDGFVILHGTDTMAYTASALPFMLQGLRKPVILTGSQVPLCEIRNDARENLITSLLLAAYYPIPEVGLFFGRSLYRGCRSIKVSASGFDAFASPNYPALATAGTDIQIHWEHVQPTQGEWPLTVRSMNQATVGALRLFPGISPAVLDNMLNPPLQGLVLEAYGVGNGPTHNQAFLDVLAAAHARGIVIVDCTQCIRGAVNLQSYATGSGLAQVGVVSGLDMTAEAALAKMYYLFTAGYHPEDIRQHMKVNMCGELTPIS